ncbi:membrane-spanning 4-domains subfamily A member 15-like [Puntigrus tetrazona]|uniref:membrane-spanning 4-domains subfamily A member 15-like n=1 Tax=Puntigrus tetrazona TaxID=1606681 RepID=UPI001C892E65|nr:membrane-spanning 4-domains subfamily A member 15-like [Puntigrus tetrazona]
MSTDKATVIIQINPQVTQDDGEKSGEVYRSTALTEFPKTQPKALGSVQIMTGVMVGMMAILRFSSSGYRFYVSSGILFWGSLIYITAGSLSVAAENKLHLCMVKAALIMNVISAMAAATAIVLTSIDINACLWHYKYYGPCLESQAWFAILLVLSILQFIISVWISGFACKASSHDPTVVNVVLNQENESH